MKKLISFILASFMSVSLCAGSVLASGPSLSVNRSHDVVTGVVTVTGSVDYKRGEVPLTLLVEKDGVLVFGDDAVTTPVKNDANLEDDNKFTINSFRFTSSMTEGKYKFTVYARYLNLRQSFEMEYVPNSQWFNIIKTIKDNKGLYDAAAGDEAKEAVLTSTTAHITSNILKTDMNDVTYSGLSASAKNLISKSAISAAYDIPETWTDTTENVNKLAAAITVFKDACANGVLFAELYDSYVQGDEAASKTRFDAWYAANKTAFGLEADNGATTTLNEATFMAGEGSVFPTLYNHESFYKRIPAIAAEMNVGTVQKGFVDAAILSKVEQTFSGNTLGTFLGTYASYIGIDYGTANANQKSIAHEAVAGKSYAKLSGTDSTALEYAVENAIPQSQQGGQNNVLDGSPTTGNTAGVVTGVVNNGTSEPVSSDEAPFKDLENYAWAKDAIDFLYRRSIISGRDEETYDPAGLVTRAEFIKMLVATYNFAAEDYSDYKFNDIVGGEWYAIYVKKAAAMGIVTGDENGNFNPNRTITRQDMAVTVYRASKFPDSTEELPFNDKSEISSYAQAAVGSLYEKGVVSGMGDKRFAPLENVTRAQAAQILYNVLIETKK